MLCQLSYGGMRMLYIELGVLCATRINYRVLGVWRQIACLKLFFLLILHGIEQWSVGHTPRLSVGR